MSFIRRGFFVSSLPSSAGGVLIMTLVFISMFLVIFTSLAGLVSRQHRQTVLQSNDELAFQVAESGLNYARWRLSHDSEDLSAISKEVVDQFAGVLGDYDVTFTKPPGSTVTEITAIGRTSSLSNREVTLKVKYGSPSLARYVFITNSDVWYGGEISGAVHSNGGIRMDGESDSLMSSHMVTYICTPVHACDNEEKPGVWGSGEKEELWEVGVDNVDYESITLDLLDIKTAAIAADTYYGDSNQFGYHIVFNENNTYSIYEVTQLQPQIPSYFSETGWQWLSHDILNEQLIETKDVPSNGVIYVEDTVWVEGEIRDRLTLAAGVFPDSPSTNVDVIINGDISYGNVKDGSRAFGLIAQRHVLIPWSGADDDLEINGAFIAKNGRFGRRYYPDCCGASAHRLKTKMERFGMVASNLIPVTAWVDGNGTVISGYQEGEVSYDPNLLFLPPPDFPASGEPEFISWEEVE